MNITPMNLSMLYWVFYHQTDAKIYIKYPYLCAYTVTESFSLLLEGVWHGGILFGGKRSSQYRDLPSLEYSLLGI
jgi:hypothetical protein